MFPARSFDTTQVALVAPDGRELFDTGADAKNLENCLSREKIQSSLKTRAEETSRFLQTMAKQTCYYTLRLNRVVKKQQNAEH